MTKYAYLAAAISLLAFPAYADHASLGGNTASAGPIHTIGAQTLPAGTFTVGITSEFVKSDRFSDNELEDLAAQHIHAHSSDYMLTHAVNLSYGLAEDLTVSLRLPYVYRDNIRAGHHSHGPAGNTAESHGDVGGIGDASVLAQFRVLSHEPTRTKAAILFGLKTPTGETGKKHEGEKLDAEHQPGSGSWDPLAGVAVTKHFGPISVDANTLVAFTQQGAQETYLGRRVNYNLAVSYRPHGESHLAPCGCHEEGEASPWNFTLELNGTWSDKRKTGNEVDNDSGGNEIFLSPGVRYALPSKWSGFVSVGVPVVSNLGAGHTDTDYKITAGIGKSF